MPGQERHFERKTEAGMMARTIAIERATTHPFEYMVVVYHARPPASPDIDRYPFTPEDGNLVEQRFDEQCQRALHQGFIEVPDRP